MRCRIALVAERNSEFVCAGIGAARTYGLSKGTLLIPIVVGIPNFISDLNLLSLRDVNDEPNIRGLAVGVDDALKKHLIRLRGKYPAVLVSHRHKDQELVRTLVGLLTAAFGLDTSDVRCTSVHPYKLKAGSRTPDRLKAQIASSARQRLGWLPLTRADTAMYYSNWAPLGDKTIDISSPRQRRDDGTYPAPDQRSTPAQIDRL